jgi:hypothetical protein
VNENSSLYFRLKTAVLNLRKQRERARDENVKKHGATHPKVLQLLEHLLVFNDWISEHLKWLQIFDMQTLEGTISQSE